MGNLVTQDVTILGFVNLSKEVLGWGKLRCRICLIPIKVEVSHQSINKTCIKFSLNMLLILDEFLILRSLLARSERGVANNCAVKKILLGK
jgi:hypothetical protein